MKQFEISTTEQDDLLISGKLLLHAADAFTQIHGESETAVPASRSSVQKSTFLAQLPEEFTTKECWTFSRQFGVSTRTIDNWLSRWIADGTLIKEKQGLYRKSA